MNTFPKNSPLYDDPFVGLSIYHSPEREPDLCTRLLPTFMFYLRLFKPVATICHKARFGAADDVAWVRSSTGVMRAMEHTACTVHVEGLDNFTKLEGPCVFAANHMSTLETFVLPCIIQPRKPVTFVVKKSLTTMPLFGPVMRSRDPITVERKNPRQDLVNVLEEGEKRLAKGISVIIFPQSTRSVDFNPEKFNSIAVKLAKRANVPLVPLALKTNAWGQGKTIKELGSINPQVPIRFRFGAPMIINGVGKAEQAHLCAFIQASLEEWHNIDPHVS